MHAKMHLVLHFHLFIQHNLLYTNILTPYCFLPVAFRCGTLLGHTLRNTVWNTSQSPAPLPQQPLLWTHPHHHGNGSGWSDRGWHPADTVL